MQTRHTIIALACCIIVISLTAQKNVQQAQIAVPKKSFREVAAAVLPAVARVRSFFSGPQHSLLPEYDNIDEEEGMAPQTVALAGFSGAQGPLIKVSASGVVIRSEGVLITSSHVVSGADSVFVDLYDGRSFRARVIGSDKPTDIALLGISAKELAFIPFGNSDSAEIGDPVMSAGSPFDLPFTITSGIISAKDRDLHINLEKYAVESYIQTDAPMNKGCSGGALVDENGRLIGMNTAMTSVMGGYAGYSFAVPVELIRKVADDLLQAGKVRRVYMGIQVADETGAANTNPVQNVGVRIASVDSGGAARNAGLQAGDRIVSVNGIPVRSVPRLKQLLARANPGDRMDIRTLRDGKLRQSMLRLEAIRETITDSEAGKTFLEQLGLDIADLSQSEKERLKITSGIRVLHLRPGKVARSAEIQDGFVITQVNGKAVGSSDGFIESLRGKTGGVLLEGFYPGIPGNFYYAFGL